MKCKHVVFQACKDLAAGVVFLRKLGLQFLLELDLAHA